jgi:hypothetical protein
MVASVSQFAQLLGTKDVAAILGWSTAKVKRHARSGDLPYAHKMEGDTGAYLFDRAVVEAFANEETAA